MPTHGSVAKKVRERKEAHPELYCRARNCLWYVGGGVCCPTHGFKDKDGKAFTPGMPGTTYDE